MNRRHEATLRAEAARRWVEVATSDLSQDFTVEIRAAIGLLQESLRWWLGEQDAA
jgi:hypothetical protein